MGHNSNVKKFKAGILQSEFRRIADEKQGNFSLSDLGISRSECDQINEAVQRGKEVEIELLPDKISESIYLTGTIFFDFKGSAVEIFYKAKAKKGFNPKEIKRRTDEGVKKQAKEIDLGFGLSDMGFSETECALILEIMKQEDGPMIHIEMPPPEISPNKAGKIVLTLLILGVSALLIWGFLRLINVL